jgi:hypothetical protein
MKIVVFDLDETLGYFTEFGIFWDSLVYYLKCKDEYILTQDDFNDILDLYPEFLRPNILNILTYLKEQKKTNCCHKMMIYTNNNGPSEWVHHIIDYFEKKINYKLIDQIIAAFKVNDKTVEICRTTHSKTHKDFIRCTKIPTSAEICFLDDTFYPEMANDNIYYINVKPYYHDLKFDYMIKKLKESQIGKKIINYDKEFEEKMIEQLKLYNYNCIDKDSKEYDLDKILGKHIISHLQEFFNKSKKNKTLRNRIKRNVKRNKTVRNN